MQSKHDKEAAAYLKKMFDRGDLDIAAKLVPYQVGLRAWADSQEDALISRISQVSLKALALIQSDKKRSEIHDARLIAIQDLAQSLLADARKDKAQYDRSFDDFRF